MGILEHKVNVRLNVNTSLENIEKINSTIKKILNTSLIFDKKPLIISTSHGCSMVFYRDGERRMWWA